MFFQLNSLCVSWLPSGSTQSFGMWGYNVPWGIVSKRAERGQKTSELSSFHTEGNQDWGKVYFPEYQVFWMWCLSYPMLLSVCSWGLFSLFRWSYFPVFDEDSSPLWNFLWSRWSFLPLTGGKKMISNCHLIVHYLVVLVIVASDCKLNESVKLSSVFVFNSHLLH